MRPRLLFVQLVQLDICPLYLVVMENLLKLLEKACEDIRKWPYKSAKHFWMHPYKKACILVVTIHKYIPCSSFFNYNE